MYVNFYLMLFRLGLRVRKCYRSKGYSILYLVYSRNLIFLLQVHDKNCEILKSFLNFYAKIIFLSAKNCLHNFIAIHPQPNIKTIDRFMKVCASMAA